MQEWSFGKGLGGKDGWLLVASSGGFGGGNGSGGGVYTVWMLEGLELGMRGCDLII